MTSELNRAAKDRILQLLKKDPIAFIGAGLSKPHYRDWPGLIEQLSGFMGKNVTDGLHPIKQAQELRDADEGNYQKALIHIFGTYPPDCPLALQKLVSCGFKSYVTTNYDCSIELAFNKNNRPIPRRISYPKLSEGFLECESIHHIHGTIDPKRPETSQLILDEDSYREAYKDDSLKNYIFSLFSRQNILFTGYSLDDSEPIIGIIELVEKQIKDFTYHSKKPQDQKSWVCLSSVPVDPTKIKNLSKIGIDVIGYDPIDESHSGLTNLWTEISKQHTPVPPESIPPIFNPLQD